MYPRTETKNFIYGINMAFNQVKFSPVGGNSAPSPGVYSYFTDDSLVEVTSGGYFIDKITTLDTGDIILAYIDSNVYILSITGDNGTASVFTEVAVIEDNSAIADAASQRDKTNKLLKALLIGIEAISGQEDLIDNVED